jgi:hypothetical protein
MTDGLRAYALILVIRMDEDAPQFEVPRPDRTRSAPILVIVADLVMGDLHHLALLPSRCSRAAADQERHSASWSNASRNRASAFASCGFAFSKRIMEHASGLPFSRYRLIPAILCQVEGC